MTGLNISLFKSRGKRTRGANLTGDTYEQGGKGRGHQLGGK